MEGCPDKGSEGWWQVETGMEWVKQEIVGGRKMKKYSGCFDGGIRQPFCGRWRTKDGDGSRFAQVSGVVVSMGIG